MSPKATFSHADYQECLSFKIGLYTANTQHNGLIPQKCSQICKLNEWWMPFNAFPSSKLPAPSASGTTFSLIQDTHFREGERQVARTVITIVESYEWQMLRDLCKVIQKAEGGKKSLSLALSLITSHCTQLWRPSPSLAKAGGRFTEKEYKTMHHFSAISGPKSLINLDYYTSQASLLLSLIGVPWWGSMG